MNVKSLTKLVLSVLLYMISALTVFSDNNQHQESPSTNNSGYGFLDSLYKSTNRKRMPSKNAIQIYYMDGILSLMSETCEDSFNLDLLNIETLSESQISDIEVGGCCQIELECGLNEVVATNSQNQTYAGELLIE